MGEQLTGGSTIATLQRSVKATCSSVSVKTFQSMLPTEVLRHRAALCRHRRRKIYDETGSLEDSEQLSSDAYNSLYDYYRTLYPKVTDCHNWFFTK